MEWIKVINKSIEYIEKNIHVDIAIEDLCKQVHMSPFYFQKSFSMMTGYSLGEYIRNRRLYLAALDLIDKDYKIIDLAYRYGYETPESFSKAFSRFHGLSPMKLKKEPFRIKAFHPIDINLSIKGGNQLDYTIETMDAFKVIGISKGFTYENAFNEIPKFWAQWRQEYLSKLSVIEETKIPIGKYGISVDSKNNYEDFQYYIGGDFDEQFLNEDFEILEIPRLRWVKFSCIGPMPTSIQALNRRIFNEWLPENKDYKLGLGYNIEVYHMGDINDLDYRCEIWIPIKHDT